jgi:hypothetical protein
VPTLYRTKIVNGVAVVRTDRQTFSFVPSISEIFFGKDRCLSLLNSANVTRKEWIPPQCDSKHLKLRRSAAENNAVMSNKLMEIFDVISSNPTEKKS